MAISYDAASKNRQSDEKIREMAALAFPGRMVMEIVELNAGMCNALYKLILDDGAKTVLKISAPGMGFKCSNERWLMESETEAMRLIEEKAPYVKAPKLLFYDDSQTVCSGKYFFMEYIEGDLMAERIPALSQAQVDELHREVGRYVNEIGAVKHSQYGIVNSGFGYDTLFGLVKLLVENVVGDLEAHHADLGMPYDAIRARLEQDRPAFDAYAGEPSLVHFDIWENNIILQDDQIASLLDWERALWGEVLMEERFRDYNDIPAFYDGFGQHEFSPEERVRLLWYNIWMDFACMNEGFFRMYADDSKLIKWRKRFWAHWAELTGEERWGENSFS